MNWEAGMINKGATVAIREHGRLWSVSFDAWKDETKGLRLKDVSSDKTDRNRKRDRALIPC